MSVQLHTESWREREAEEKREFGAGAITALAEKRLPLYQPLS